MASQLSRTHQVSRQTLYRWLAMGQQALQEALGKKVLPVKRSPSISTLVLTMLIETHASYRGIQSALKSLHGIKISTGKIAALVKEAGQRAQSGWTNNRLRQHVPSPWMNNTAASVEKPISTSLMSIVGKCGRPVPPVQVDGESWTLLLWYVREQGIESVRTVSDGGRAIQEAVHQVYGQGNHQRDVWHPCMWRPKSKDASIVR